MPSDDLEPMVEAVFDVVHDLYITFLARSFMLVDVPPIDRSMGGSSMYVPSLTQRNYSCMASHGIVLG